LKYNIIIDSLNVNSEVKNLLQEGLNKADGDWVLFLNTFLEVMLDEEDYENACHVRDTLLKFQRGATDKVHSSNFPN
jgi:protein-arginine kinase activator protein McsA